MSRRKRFRLSINQLGAIFFGVFVVIAIVYGYIAVFISEDLANFALLIVGSIFGTIAIIFVTILFLKHAYSH